jgi:hypothetical protein
MNYLSMCIYTLDILAFIEELDTDYDGLVSWDEYIDGLHAQAQV